MKTKPANQTSGQDNHLRYDKSIAASTFWDVLPVPFVPAVVSSTTSDGDAGAGAAATRIAVPEFATWLLLSLGSISAWCTRLRSRWLCRQGTGLVERASASPLRNSVDTLPRASSVVVRRWSRAVLFGLAVAAPLVARAKASFSVQHFLVWHAVVGYWGGVDPEALPDYGVVAQTRHFGDGILHHMPLSHRRLNIFFLKQLPQLLF